MDPSNGHRNDKRAHRNPMLLSALEDGLRKPLTAKTRAVVPLYQVPPGTNAPTAWMTVGA